MTQYLSIPTTKKSPANVIKELSAILCLVSLSLRQPQTEEDKYLAPF